MENARDLQLRADEHRAAGRATPDLWESVIRLQLAARYEELALRAAAKDRPTKPPA
jgi:hypothetical protein